ncbi:YwiC-like family protein [Neobacillus sp. Marseille-QA0830]
MKLFIPKQHGAWAMLIIPFWLGVMDGGFVWQHIPFFIGWFFLYLATYPLLFLFKRKKMRFYIKWSSIYLVLALAFLSFPLVKDPTIIYFGFAMIPFFVINAYFSSIKRDRAFLNDISAVVAFSMAGLASSYFGSGTITLHTILFSWLSSILFFIGSTFYVKTMIREKNNNKYKWISWIYHILVMIVTLVLGQLIVALAFLPSLTRAFLFYGRKLSPKQIGIYEIINSAIFFIIMAIQILIN